MNDCVQCVYVFIGDHVSLIHTHIQRHQVPTGLTVAFPRVSEWPCDPLLDARAFQRAAIIASRKVIQSDQSWHPINLKSTWHAAGQVLLRDF